jgi:hypothetical protein
MVKLISTKNGNLWTARIECEKLNTPHQQETQITLFAPTQDHIMKKLTIKLITAPIVTCLFFTTPMALAQVSAIEATPTEVKPARAKTIKMAKVVPAGKQYIVYDSRGKQILDLKAGSSTAEITDCAQIPCPPTFGDDVVCWKCVERITTNQGSNE